MKDSPDNTNNNPAGDGNQNNNPTDGDPLNPGDLSVGLPDDYIPDDYIPKH